MLSRYSPALLVLLALVTVACERVPLLAPSSSTITLSAESRALPPGGSTEVTAFVVESGGTPVHDGTLVRFTATLGRVDPVEVETTGGLARTTFTAGTASGTAQIRASSGGATGGTGATPTNLVEIQVGAASATAVTVSASPSRVAASGGTVTIIAAALDAAGNRLVGVPVSFSTTNGSLSASTATTDSSGEARVTLTTNREATVTARVGNQSGTTAVSVGTAPSLTLAVSPASPMAGSPVTLTITPASGTMPRVVVNWGDGRTEDLGTVPATRSVTHIYSAPGAYTITTTASEDGDSSSTAAAVTVVSGVGVTLSDPSPTSPVEDLPVTFTVTPASGTSPRVVINWGDGTSTDLGIVSAARSVVHTYGSPGSYVVTATATAGSETATQSKAVTVTAAPAINVNVSASDTAPDRCEVVTFTATPTPSSESIASYRWTIDSNTDSEDEAVTTTGTQLSRAFPTSGTKTISVTATTTNGRTGNGQTQIVVRTVSVCP